MPSERFVLKLKERFLQDGVIIDLYLNNSGFAVAEDTCAKTILEWESMLSLSEVEIRDRYSVKPCR